MTAEPLKPCPFCNGNSRLWDDEENYFIACDRCGSCGATRESEAEAIAAWNNRAEPLGNPEELPLWMKEIITEKLMPGSRPWNYETRVIMDTLEWVLSLNKPEKE